MKVVTTLFANNACKIGGVKIQILAFLDALIVIFIGFSCFQSCKEVEHLSGYHGYPQNQVQTLLNGSNPFFYEYSLGYMPQKTYQMSCIIMPVVLAPIINQYSR